MRVVAGTAGGRQLRGPAASSRTRPTTDRTREAMFNSLDSLSAVDDRAVLDLFAGTGACGIEALSRGARSATFVDDSRACRRLIADNLAIAGFTGEIVTVDVFAFLRTAGAYDLVIADPPYDFSRWPELLRSVTARYVVCEAAEPVKSQEGWSVQRQKKYGGTVVTVFASEAGHGRGDT